MDFTTMGTADLIERRKAIGEECNTANGADLDALEAELDAINAELESRKAAEEKRQTIRDAVAAGAGEIVAEIKEERKENIMTLKELRGSEKYLDAFVRYLKTNKDDECRRLMSEIADPNNVGEDDSASVPVPVIVDEMIAESWNRSHIMSRVRHTFLRGIARFPFELSSTGASVHAEGAEAPAAEKLVLGNVTITPEMLKKWIPLTDEAIALSGQAFLDYIWDEIEQKIFELADEAVVDAILNAPAVADATHVSVPAVTVTEIGATTVFTGLAELADSADAPVAIMNRATFFNKIMSAVDDNNRPIFNIVSENGRPTYYANGVEAIFDANVPADTVLVGDLRGVVANFPKGDSVEFVNDPYTKAEEDILRIIGKMYVGVGLVKDKFFVKVSVSA